MTYSGKYFLSVIFDSIMVVYITECVSDRKMPRGRNQMSYFGCPENDMAHMQRPPGPCFDNYPKMDGHCG